MMRLNRIQNFLKGQGWPYRYGEDNDCGGIEFEYRGLNYHIWEYPEPERGAASNVACAGRMEDYEGDYEAAILAVLKTWEGVQ